MCFPPPGEVEVPGLEAELGPLVKENSLSEEERRERDLEKEKISDRFRTPLIAACSKKKKRRHYSR